ncbi:MAG: ATP-binding cassette domain-containing protein [Bacilli bacterium]
MSILEVKNLTVNKPDAKEDILNNVSLSFEKKKIYIITGPNGGGKSTFAKSIMGMMPAASGQILVNGKDITSLDIVGRSKAKIGYAFQTPVKLKGISVKSLLDLAKTSNSHITARQALRMVGLCPEDYFDRNLDDSFSGGELKRIEIASILVRDLDIAIFDEPEAGIDLWSFQRLVETFNNLREATDTCIIIISHQERIMRFADEVIVIDKGHVTKQESNDEFLSKIPDSTYCCRRKNAPDGGKSC